MEKVKLITNSIWTGIKIAGMVLWMITLGWIIYYTLGNAKSVAKKEIEVIIQKGKVNREKIKAETQMEMQKIDRIQRMREPARQGRALAEYMNRKYGGFQ